MHVVIDARGALPTVDGIHVYIKNVVPTVIAQGSEQKRFRSTLLSHPALVDAWRALVPTATVVSCAVRPTSVGQNWKIPKLLADLGTDLYFYPSHDPPLLTRTRFVFTLHDLNMFRLRPYFERLDVAKRSYFRTATTAGLLRAKAVFAVSEATKAEVGRVFGERFLPKVHVTHNGIARAPTHSDVAQDARDRILYVGIDRPHKNLLRLVEAYGLARVQAPDLPRLELIGTVLYPDKLEAARRAAGVTEHAVVRGHLPSEEVDRAYAHAQTFVFASLAEGFGIPILEAMSRGVPVVTSDDAACREVAGDAALVVDARDARAIADAIVRLHRDADLREELVRRGYERVAKFGWRETALRTYDVLAGALPSMT